MIDKYELLEAIAARFGDLCNRCGCYVPTDNGGEWLSIAAIVDIINAVDEYED